MVIDHLKTFAVSLQARVTLGIYVLFRASTPSVKYIRVKTKGKECGVDLFTSQSTELVEQLFEKDPINLGFTAGWDSEGGRMKANTNSK